MLYRTVFCMLVSLAGAFGCSAKSDRCFEHKADVEQCGLRYNDPDVCETPASQCAIECHHQAGCDVLRGLSDGADPPASYSRCVAQCMEPFSCDEGETTISEQWRCDGDADCQDGADEDGCEYHTCADGQLVRASARCDDYAHCRDDSDEEGCP